MSRCLPYPQPGYFKKNAEIPPGLAKIHDKENDAEKLKEKDREKGKKEKDRDKDKKKKHKKDGEDRKRKRESSKSKNGEREDKSVQEDNGGKKLKEGGSKGIDKVHVEGVKREVILKDHTLSCNHENEQLKLEEKELTVKASDTKYDTIQDKTRKSDSGTAASKRTASSAGSFMGNGKVCFSENVVKEKSVSQVRDKSVSSDQRLNGVEKHHELKPKETKLKIRTEDQTKAFKLKTDAVSKRPEASITSDDVIGSRPPSKVQSDMKSATKNDYSLNKPSISVKQPSAGSVGKASQPTPDRVKLEGSNSNIFKRKLRDDALPSDGSMEEKARLKETRRDESIQKAKKELSSTSGDSAKDSSGMPRVKRMAEVKNPQDTLGEILRKRAKVEISSSSIKKEGSILGAPRQERKDLKSVSKEGAIDESASVKMAKRSSEEKGGSKIGVDKYSRDERGIESYSLKHKVEDSTSILQEKRDGIVKEISKEDKISRSSRSFTSHDAKSAANTQRVSEQQQQCKISSFSSSKISHGVQEKLCNGEIKIKFSHHQSEEKTHCSLPNGKIQSISSQTKAAPLTSSHTKGKEKPVVLDSKPVTQKYSSVESLRSSQIPIPFEEYKKEDGKRTRIVEVKQSEAEESRASRLAEVKESKPAEIKQSKAEEIKLSPGEALPCSSEEYEPFQPTVLQSSPLIPCSEPEPEEDWFLPKVKASKSQNQNQNQSGMLANLSQDQVQAQGQALGMKSVWEKPRFLPEFDICILPYVSKY